MINICKMFSQIQLATADRTSVGCALELECPSTDTEFPHGFRLACVFNKR